MRPLRCGIQSIYFRAGVKDVLARVVPGDGVGGASAQAAPARRLQKMDDAHLLTHDAAGVLLAARIPVGVRPRTRGLTGPAHPPTLAPNTLLACDPAIRAGGYDHDGHRIGLLVTLALGLLVVPLTAEAQPPTHVHRIGALTGYTRGQDRNVEAFLEGMRALGYVEGQHLVLEYRGSAGQHERFPALAAELVRLPVDVLLVGPTPAALAAKDATTTIPIVMAGVGDPVGSGLVASLARPGGNVTGVSVLQTEVVGKQLEFLKAVLPTVARVAVLRNPANAGHALVVREADVAAQRLGVQLHLGGARSRRV
jgi:ABC transporter substrate binding protein